LQFWSVILSEAKNLLLVQIAWLMRDSECTG